MPSLLALTDVSVVSLSVMRLTIVWSVAFDQLACQPAPRNCGSSAVVEEGRPSAAAVMLAAAGSFWVKPKCVWNAASKAVLAGEPAALKSFDRLHVGVDAGEEMLAVDGWC